MSLAQRRVLLFFLVAYALTWFGWLGNWLVPGPYWPLPMNPFGPIIAAPLVIWATDGRDGLRRWWKRLIRFRAPPWIYVVALFVPIGIIFASLTLALLSGAEQQSLPERELGEFLILIPILLLAGPMEEEPAFRGYAQKELEAEMTPFAASLMVGIGVLVWHVPVFLTGSVPWPFVATIVAVSAVYAWLYQQGGSIWPLVLLHFSVNYFGGEFLGETVAPGGQVLYASYFAVFYIAWAAFIVWRYGPSLRSSAAPA
jgi:membrane protease YdiL (CAAX protease family)